MLFIAFQRGFCTTCGEDRGETLVCQSCGWKDPPTIQDEEYAKEIRKEYQLRKAK